MTEELAPMKIYKAEIVPWENTDEDGVFGLMLMAEVEGKFYKDLEVSCSDFDFAYKIMRHCQTSTEPFIVEMSD